jgi:hypothetical protein
MGQVVECLLNKHKALRLNPSTAQKKKIFFFFLILKWHWLEIVTNLNIQQ